MYTVPVYFHRYIYVPAEVNLQAHACARHYGRRWTCTVVVLVLVLARLVRCRGHARPAVRTNAKRTQSAPRIGRTAGRRVVLADRSNVQLVPSSSSSSVGTPGYSDLLWRSGSGPAWMRRLPRSAAAAWSRSRLASPRLALPCLALDSWARPRPSFQTLLLPTTAFQQVRAEFSTSLSATSQPGPGPPALDRCSNGDVDDSRWGLGGPPRRAQPHIHGPGGYVSRLCWRAAIIYHNTPSGTGLEVV